MVQEGFALHPLWSAKYGEGALFATALHSGHDIRHELSGLLLIDENSRLREEDPFTDELANICPNFLIPTRSRFEVDLNRTRSEAVYQRPEDAWGLHIWKKQLDKEIVQRSLEEFDQFYDEIEHRLRQLEREYCHFVAFDLHSYNHRRNGPEKPPEDPEKNPEINIGTGTMDRRRWAHLVDHFMSDLRGYNYQGRHLDVRENVKFMGRQFATFVHKRFPRSGCVLSVEIKKFFMDEWTGRLDKNKFNAIIDALKSTIPGIQEELNSL